MSRLPISAAGAILLFGAIPLAGCNSIHGPLEVHTDPPVEKTLSDYGDATWIGYSFGHGTQVSYSTRDGRIFLWYPGNRVILRGTWSVREDKPYRVEGPTGPMTVAQNFICFRYGPDTYNPVTGNRGGGAECMRTRAFGKHYVSEIRRGDVFGLSTRREVPFVLPSGPTSIDSLLTRMPSGS